MYLSLPLSVLATRHNRDFILKRTRGEILVKYLVTFKNNKIEACLIYCAGLRLVNDIQRTKQHMYLL